MNQTDPRAVANLLVGSHYECEDPWYSCPLSVEGCADETKPKECECGHDKLVEAIARALADAERRGLERAAKIADDFDRLTCAEMERKYRLRIDVRRLNLGDNIARCIRSQAQADKEEK